MKASIVVPVLNWRCMPGFLDSLRARGLEGLERDDVELIVLDNHREAEPEPAELAAAAEDDRIESVRLIRHYPTAPLHRAWNVGTRAAAADHVLVVNDDIIWGRRCVLNLCKALDQHGLWSCYPTPAETPDAEERVMAEPMLTGPPEHRGWAMAFTREGLDGIGPWDESFELFYGDDDCWMRLIDAGHPAREVHNAFIHHLGSESIWRLPTGVPGGMYNRDYDRFQAKWGGKRGQDLLREKGLVTDDAP